MTDDRAAIRESASAGAGVNAGDLRLRPTLCDDQLVRQPVHEGGQWRFRQRRCQFITSRGLADSPEVS
jgi:hypothetical protein